MTGVILAHDTGDIVNTSPDSYLGSPMYDVVGVHAPALIAVAVLAVWFLVVRRRVKREGLATAPAWYRRYRWLDVSQRTQAWLVAGSAAAHLALVPTHLDSFYAVLFLVDGLLQAWLVRGLIRNGTWSRWLRPILAASLVGYAFSSFTGEAPDQVGMLVKLAELTALALAVHPTGRLARIRMATGHLTLTVVVGAGAWIGAMAAGDGGHHLGETPPPGVLLPPGEDRDPTPGEQAAADRLHADVVAAISRYDDIDLAAAAGYAVDGIAGVDFHADNDALKDDAHILDPERPETLVYAVGASGEPVLLGAMFQMDHIGQRGPAPAGPLMVWHGHDHICLSPLPPFLAGMTGPYGVCPLGSLTMPITNEMLHVWTVPGAPDPFGELDEEWLADYLASR